jgi:membrane protein DedA with SNARE-associated domain
MADSAPYGYLAVFAGVLLEDVGLPVPGETLLIGGAILAARGELSLPSLLVLAWLAAVIGDNLGYALGYFGGRPLLDRFRRHGGKVVIGARFVDGLRQLNGIVAGAARMPWQRFIAFNALGAGLWVGAWGCAGFLVGERLDAFISALGRLHAVAFWGIVAAAAVAAVAALLLARRSSTREP